MKYFSMESLNRKALNKITMLHKMILNHSSELANGFDLPLCREKNGAELSSKDFETLFGTYNFWRISNGLCNLSYITKLFEVGNISTTEKSVSVETFTIRVGSMALSTSDFEPSTDIPTEFLKRDGKSEKAKTAENKKKASDNNPSPSEPSTVPPTEPAPTSEPSTVSPSEELDNEEKALENSAKKFNGEVVKDIQEVSMRRIGLIFGVDWKDMTKEQKTSLADALNEFVTMLDKGSVM